MKAVLFQGWDISQIKADPLEFEFKIRDQSILLEPTIEHGRFYLFNLLTEVIGGFICV